jgi:hypothetical protein
MGRFAHLAPAPVDGLRNRVSHEGGPCLASLQDIRDGVNGPGGKLHVHRLRPLLGAAPAWFLLREALHFRLLDIPKAHSNAL